MDKPPSYLTFKYVGRRFDGGKLPIDVLSDLHAFRDLIAAFAKSNFKKSHPDRKRVPQGFDRSISFALVGIDDGSAIPRLELQSEVAQQNLPNIANHIDEFVKDAYRQVIDFIETAAGDEEIIALPQDAIRAFSKFGANIKDAEKIEFTKNAANGSAIVSLDSYRRKILLKRISEQYTIDFSGIGILTGVDISHNTIQIKTDEYNDIKMNLEGTLIDINDFTGSLSNKVEFSLSIILDKNDIFKSVSEIYTVDLIKPHTEDLLRCVKRIDSISKNEPGWLEENQGVRLVHQAAMNATRIVFMRAELANIYRIYPTESGGISIEFDIGKWSYAIEVQPQGSVDFFGSSEDSKQFGPMIFENISDDFFTNFDEIIAKNKR